MEKKSVYFMCFLGVGTKELCYRDSLCVHPHVQESPRVENHVSL